MSEPFIAEIRIFAGNFAPRGWAFCDGQTLPIAQNTALFALLGTTYGGDGRTNFAVPNLQGRAPMHPGQGPGLTSRRLGELVGADTVTLTESELPSHNHPLNATSVEADQDRPIVHRPATADGDLVYGTGTETAMLPTNPSGGSQAHNNVQPYLAVYYIIALVGLFPSRS